MTQADSLLWISGIAAEAVVFALLLWRRVFRTLPIFTFYLLWSLITDVAQYAAANDYPASRVSVYLISTVIDSLLEFGVLFELSRAVLRPMAKFLPRWTPVAVGVLIALVCAIVWPFASAPGFDQYTLESRLLIHLEQTYAILRIVFFLALAACSQLLSIGWRDRELQIATGLGFYSMVSVAVSVLHTHQSATSPEYHLADQLMVGSYLCSLLYWVSCFAQQEAARRQFTPQMQNFLLAMAGTARTTRIALTKFDPEQKDRGDANDSDRHH